MRKKFLNSKMLGVLAVFLVVFMAVGVAEEKRTDAGGQWKYALEDGGATITGYVGIPAEELVIPGELDGYPVTGIGYWAFYSRRGLTTVTIPAGVTSIGAEAFAYNYRLTDLIIPEGVTSIGDRAFTSCIGLVSITIPESVTSIGKDAFWRCEGLTGSVTIPEGLISMQDNPFVECPLTHIDVSVNNPVFESIGGVLFDKQRKALIAFPNAMVGEYTVPDGVLNIGDEAFAFCKNLTGVMIPESVTSIGEGAFYACESLISITIPASVTSIGDMAFRNCESLTGVIIPDGVTSIGDMAFRNCESLTSMTIPASVTEIGSNPFRSCSLPVINVSPDNPVYAQIDGVLYDTKQKELVSFPGGWEGAYTIPDGTLHIGEGAFAWCYGLTSVTIPDSVTSIGEDAFYWCESLTSVTIPASVTEIGKDAFDDCIKLVLSVAEGSYAEQYAEYNDLPYVLISSADAANAETEEITVGTAAELLAALGSNRRILLKEGVYNLTAAEEGFTSNPNVYFRECYDGVELFVDDVYNLTIQGADDGQSKIVAEPRYAFVMSFQNCSNVSLVNLWVGHTESTVSECERGVLHFAGTTGIRIDGTQMYGCGTVGLSLVEAANVKVTDSRIFRCTYSIMEIYDSYDILFSDCVFEDNIGEVFAETVSNLTIDSCSFLRNTDAYNLFDLSKSENVIVKNTKFIDNEAKDLLSQLYSDVEFDAFNRFENNTFDENR